MHGTEFWFKEMGIIGDESVPWEHLAAFDVFVFAVDSTICSVLDVEGLLD